MNLKLPDLVTKSVFDVVKENFQRVKLVFHSNCNIDYFENEIITKSSHRSNRLLPEIDLR